MKVCAGEIVKGAPMWAIEVTPGREPDANRESMLRQMHEDAMKGAPEQVTINPGFGGISGSVFGM